MSSKVSGVQIGTISGLLLGSHGTKNHSDVGAVGKCREYYMGEGGRGKVVASLKSEPW